MLCGPSRAELFAALPGAGATLAPRLLVAFGDQPERYPNAQSLQKYAGVAPVREKSGQKSWTHWRWAAPKFLRQSFVEWAGQTVVHCGWARVFYQRQLQAGKAHHAILRALAFNGSASSGAAGTTTRPMMSPATSPPSHVNTPHSPPSRQNPDFSLPGLPQLLATLQLSALCSHDSFK